MKVIKLSEPQKRAMAVLTSEWTSSYSLRVGRNTLDALVRKGLAERRAGLGELFSPSTSIKYRRRIGE